MTSQLAICILSSELPLDGAALGISIALPGTHLGLQALAGCNSTIQALAAQDADLYLCHVQPTGVLGRVMELHPVKQTGRVAATQHFIEALPEVDVQVVQNQVNATGVGIGAGKQVLHDPTKSVLARRSVTETVRRPAFGSTATNRLVVPLRTYS